MGNKQDFVIENGVLTKYTGPGGGVIIPAGVTKIGNSAFSNCANLTSVTIPAGIKKIGVCAFEGCTGLQSVTISAGVKKIGVYAFGCCADLTIHALARSKAEEYAKKNKIKFKAI